MTIQEVMDKFEEIADAGHRGVGQAEVSGNRDEIIADIETWDKVYILRIIKDIESITKVIKASVENGEKT